MTTAINDAIANGGGGGGGSSNAVVYDSSTHDLVTLGGSGNRGGEAHERGSRHALVDSKDAVNGSQLYNTASSVATALGGSSDGGCRRQCLEA